MVIEEQIKTLLLELEDKRREVKDLENTISFLMEDRRRELSQKMLKIRNRELKENLH